MHNDLDCVEVDWRWIAEARLAAMRMQSRPYEVRREAVTIARTAMVTLTAYNTPLGHSPIMLARRLAKDLAMPYSEVEETALHCAALLFFFDWIEGKEYHDIGLPQEFWRFGELMLSQVGSDHRPFFSTDRDGANRKEVEGWLIGRADRARRALAAVAGDRPLVYDSEGDDGLFR